MRIFLLVVAWASLIGSFFDAAILAHAGWLMARGEAALSMTVDTHLREHLSFVYWVKDVAYAVMPRGLVDWMFGLNALVYFPLRIILSGVIGWLCFRGAAGLNKNSGRYVDTS